MRIQFDLNESKVKELDTLMKTIGVSTKKELFDNALTFLEWAVKEIKHDPDRVIGSINEKTDSYKELQMSVFSNARSAARSETESFSSVQ